MGLAYWFSGRSRKRVPPRNCSAGILPAFFVSSYEKYVTQLRARNAAPHPEISSAEIIKGLMWKVPELRAAEDTCFHDHVVPLPRAALRSFVVSSYYLPASHMRTHYMKRACWRMPFIAIESLPTWGRFACDAGPGASPYGYATPRQTACRFCRPVRIYLLLSPPLSASRRTRERERCARPGVGCAGWRTDPPPRYIIMWTRELKQLNSEAIRY